MFGGDEIVLGVELTLVPRKPIPAGANARAQSKVLYRKTKKETPSSDTLEYKDRSVQSVWTSLALCAACQTRAGLRP